MHAVAEQCEFTADPEHPLTALLAALFPGYLAKD